MLTSRSSSTRYKMNSLGKPNCVRRKSSETESRSKRSSVLWPRPCRSRSQSKMAIGIAMLWVRVFSIFHISHWKHTLEPSGWSVAKYIYLIYLYFIPLLHYNSEADARSTPLIKSECLSYFSFIPFLYIENPLFTEVLILKFCDNLGVCM